MKTLLFCFCLLSLTLQAQDFTNVAADLGIDTGYGFGEQGGGVSFCDFNRDGLDDLTFTTDAGVQVLFFRNNGNGTFTQLSLINNTLETKDATWVDYDNDGDRDLFVTAFEGPDRLYQNQGNMNMVDVTSTALPGMGSLKSMGAVWGDYDRDGWLDLYICHYYFSGSNLENDLYRNQGNGTFVKVTSSTPANNGIKLTFDAAFVDLDEDGWQDLYVVNDKYSTANGLYMNTNGSFQAAPSQGADVAIDAMNAGGADFDDDGDFDLYVSNCVLGNELLNNDGSAFFFNQAPQTATEVFRGCWGSNFFDYDLDTDQDLYVSVQSSPTGIGNPNAMLVNLSEIGTYVFQEPFQFSGGLAGEDHASSYGNAIGDLNNDGLLDIAVVNVGGEDFFVWENQETTSNNWLKVDLFGTTSNSEGIGARVEVDVAGETLTRYRHGGQGYLSQNSAQLHFGLGSATLINEIRVVWPSGTVDVFNNVTSVNQVFSVVETEVVLPAELVHVAARKVPAGVEVSWQSASEFNLEKYELQVSTDGRRFEVVTEVLARGESELLNTYDAVDVMPRVFPRYYRLKMIDFDGAYSYSNLLTVEENDPSGFELGVPSPNPAVDFVVLPVTVPASGQVDIQLYEPDGKLLHQFEQAVTTGQNQIRLSLPFSQIVGGSIRVAVQFEGEFKSTVIVMN
ncbi:MAG: CRTAC1 family protein [Bacteroidota bacterium]